MAILFVVIFVVVALGYWIKWESQAQDARAAYKKSLGEDPALGSKMYEYDREND